MRFNLGAVGSENNSGLKLYMYINWKNNLYTTYLEVACPSYL